MFLSDLECSWCTLEKKELMEEVLFPMELVDPYFVHLDLSSRGIKLES